MTVSTALPKPHAHDAFRPPADVALEDVADHLHELSDVCLAFELLEELVSLGADSELPVEELDRKRMAAMLRVLGEALSHRIKGAQEMTIHE